MESEAFLNLYDDSWFYAQTKSSPNPDPELIQQISSKPNPISPIQLPRSRSDETFYTSSSPDSVLKPHLETILSDREFSIEIQKPPQLSRRTKRKKVSKSLSELEFEELKGFMDLGFVFSEEDNLNSRLVEIIPGLRHKEENITSEGITRPYLSEAWEISNKMAPLMNWRVPAIVSDVDMKVSLKCWAHTVASAVR